ncbi:MAG: tetratricopeptide repeat protein [Candidatus Omnitrophica bacterium]|nr:tetratricopeptide repeat protein [Candidatus Omnitrophota bacterium]
MIIKNFKSLIFLLFGLFCLSSRASFAQQNAVMNAVVSTETSSEENSSGKPALAAETGIPSQNVKPSTEFVKAAWEASGHGDLSRLESIVAECLSVYGNDAKLEEEQLTAFPARGTESQYQALNDVATCLFIKAEAYMNNGQTEEAIKQFKDIIANYKFAQAWDPRGWYWSVIEKSQDSINVLTGKAPEEEKDNAAVEPIYPKLANPGTEKVVDYSKYGKFLNVGKEDYHYSISDMDGLTKALGEGIYPNIKDVYKNPRFKVVKSQGRLEGNHWDFVNSYDLEAAYFKWATAPETWGVKLFYLGLIFEKSHMYDEALKAYQSLIVHFPKSTAWTYWQTPWYPAQAAIAKIKHILRVHPELGLKAKWMKIEVQNGFDNDITNDVIVTYPGRIVEKDYVDQFKDKFQMEDRVPLRKVVKKAGMGKVRLVQYDNGHWQMLVDNKPFVLKAVTYMPTKVGQSPDKGTQKNWMEEDTNNNGKPDGPYDAWVDANRNNQQDPDEPVVGDFELMKEMGVNAIRLYHVPTTPNKEVLRKLFKDYGIRVVMGDYLGKYTIGSGASWSEGTDYENPEHRKKMMESVQKMVMEFKDEPYILLWVLGNENNYGVACNADKKPEAYFKFANEVAKWIKSVDPNHPVAVNNGDTLYLDIFAKNCPDVDIFSANVYRGDYGFGSFWEQVMDASGKPAMISEYGCPSYAPQLTLKQAEQTQADYHRGNWLDIEDNIAGRAGVGNALGGIAFEWLDEWWKNYEPFRHDRKSDAIGPFPGGYYFEEWFGLIGQGNGQHSPFLRQLKLSYFAYKEMWNKKFF